jgi:hypothetical protein
MTPRGNTSNFGPAKPMSKSARILFPLLALLALCSATFVAPLGACRVLPPGIGGNNAGGTGIWILPYMAAEAPSGTIAPGRIYDRNGLDIELRDCAVRANDDLRVVVNGSLLVIAFDFFDTSRREGRYYDVTSGRSGLWLRD